MRKPYDKKKPDPLGIHKNVESERRKSRFRDSHSRERVHPIAYDMGKLVDFVIARRKSVPAALDAARTVLRVVDTIAIRTLVSAVLDNGRCDRYMRRRCDRVLGYCDTIEAGYAAYAAHVARTGRTQ